MSIISILKPYSRRENESLQPLRLVKVISFIYTIKGLVFINKIFLFLSAVSGHKRRTQEDSILSLKSEPPSHSRLTRLHLKKRTDNLKNKIFWLFDRQFRTYHVLIITFLIIGLTGTQVSQAYFLKPRPELSPAEYQKTKSVLSSKIDLKNLIPTTQKLQKVIIANTGGPVEEKTPIHHQVETGETLSGIAEKYGIHSGSIILANPKLSDTEIIHQGDDLLIPDHDASQEDLNKEYSERQKKVAANFTKTVRSSIPSSDLYAMPLKSYQEISQYFSSSHQAVDFATHVGSPVYAAHSGCVTEAQSGWNGGYGRVIKLNHGGGMSSLYGHLSSVTVNTGQCVGLGALIGYSGNTGHSTGPHLHFEIRKNNQRVEPLQYVRR